MIPRRWAHVLPGEWKMLLNATSRPNGHRESTIQWETTIAASVEVPHAAAVSSGRRGMTLIFEHLKLQPEDEVIVPAYTLGDLIPLIQKFGANAIPADIDRDTLNISPATVKSRITPKTKAILALHAFGVPCPIESLLAIADPKGIPIIEDAAHALGARSHGRAIGSFGYAGFYSFEVTKPINTFGGGMVVTRDSSLKAYILQQTANDSDKLDSVLQKARAARTEQRLFKTNLAFPFLYLLATPALRNMANRLYRRAQHVPASFNRYSELQSELGLAKWPGLSDRIAHRAHAAALYRALLKPTIRLQQVPESSDPTWYFLLAMLPIAAAPVRMRLLRRGIDAGIEHEIADDTALPLGYQDCPNAQWAFRHALALPMYDGIPEEHVRRTAQTLNALLP